MIKWFLLAAVPVLVVLLFSATWDTCGTEGATRNYRRAECRQFIMVGKMLTCVNSRKWVEPQACREGRWRKQGPAR